MIQVNRDELATIRKKIPNVVVTRTCREKNNGAKRGKYYVEETQSVKNVLSAIRNEKI